MTIPPPVYNEDMSRSFEYISSFGWSYNGRSYRMIVEREVFHEPFKEVKYNAPMPGLAGALGFTHPEVRTIGGRVPMDYIVTMIRRVERRQNDFALRKQVKVSRHLLEDQGYHRIRAGFLGPVMVELARTFEAEIEAKIKEENTENRPKLTGF